MLTLLTAAIHASLGGLMFTLNAAVYLALAVGMILPAIAPFRWLARLALFGFATATIAGWLLFGARFQLAYIDKAIELALLCFLAIEVWLFDGGPAGDTRRVRRLAGTVAGAIKAWTAPMTWRAIRAALGGAVLALLAVACSTASGSLGPPPTAPPGGAVIVAHDLVFDRTRVQAPAGAAFQLLFDNRDNAPHNVTILDANGASTFVGETFGGPASRIYAIPALAAGTYRFRCDVHTDMTGSLVAG